MRKNYHEKALNNFFIKHNYINIKYSLAASALYTLNNLIKAKKVLRLRKAFLFIYI